MSGLTEQEILSRHKQALKEAKDMCLQLGQNADPEKAQPRGWRYSKLQNSLKALEGSSRQMAHFREDTRWVKLGVLYARAMRTASAQYNAWNWPAFTRLAELFENGLKRMEDLEQRKTGKMGTILPKRTDWLILPDTQPRQSLWTPQGRMMN